MPEVQQVKRLILAQFQQFRLCDFDFTSPETGEPLSRICFAGPNGVGKSTVLAQIYHAIDPEMLPIAVDEDREANALILVQYCLGAQSVYLARNGLRLGTSGSKFSWFSNDIENAPGWEAFLEKGMGFHEFDDQFEEYAVNQDDSLSAPAAATSWLSPTMDLIASQPADDLREMIDKLGDERARHFNEFLKHPNHRDETVASVEQLFEEAFPDPLVAITEAWKLALEPANIQFSPDSPVGLISSRTGERIPFTSLSPGMQRYLLRTGHLRLLKLKNEHDGSIYFVDEPENGLQPPLISSLLEDILANAIGSAAQTFVTTLDPALEKTFSDAEIFRLSFDKDLGIRIQRGLGKTSSRRKPQAPSSPKTTEISHPTAVRLARLRREIKETEDQDELADLLEEVMSLRDR